MQQGIVKTGSQVLVKVSRAVSRLKAIFLTLDDQWIPPIAMKQIFSHWNYFQSPLNGQYDFTKDS